MKKFILILSISLSLLSCKKDNVDESILTARVFGLSPKTSVTIIVTDQNNRKVLEVVNKYENTTYKGLSVKSKDVLKLYINSNIKSDLEGNGNGNVFISVPKFSGTYGGNLSYPNGSIHTITLP